uniref:PRKR-interacting protein 1 n=1 Tax=Caenorhabditis tropicalis TaxID=1561998 RepID=A0A1I7U3H4_9PELO
MPRDDPITEEERKASSATDLIRMRIERLQQNIDKPAPIPMKKETLRAPKAPLEFVRNVVGSSAAAGSAEFHIYRNNRRKEQNRLDYIEAVAKKEELDDAYRQKVTTLQKTEELKTSKKRAKRLRQKAAAKKRKMEKKEKKSEDSDSSDSDSGSDSESDDEKKAEDEDATDTAESNEEASEEKKASGDDPIINA